MNDMLLVSEGGGKVFLSDKFIAVTKSTRTLVHQQYLVEQFFDRGHVVVGGNDATSIMN